MKKLNPRAVKYALLSAPVMPLSSLIGTYYFRDQPIPNYLLREMSAAAAYVVLFIEGLLIWLVMSYLLYDRLEKRRKK